MSQRPSYLGVRDLVEELARQATVLPLRRSYRSKEALVEAVVAPLNGYLRERLTPLGLGYRMWRGVAEAGEGIRPTEALGTVFLPDAALEVAGTPTVALMVSLLRAQRDLSSKIGSVLGEALVLSQHYPAVLALLHNSSSAYQYHTLVDREMLMGLWRSYKIRLVMR